MAMGSRQVRRFTSRLSRRKERPEPKRGGGGLTGLVVAVAMAAGIAALTRGAVPEPQAGSALLHSARPSPATSAAPRGIVVSPVRPRQDVPQELVARDWLAEVADTAPGADGGSLSEAGTLGSTARLILPPAEHGLAVGAGLVATASATPGGSILRIRDIASGAVRRSVEVGQRVANAVLVGQLLLWSGWADAGHAIDGGVMSLDLGDAASTPQAIVAPGLSLKAFGPEAGRGLFHASSTGRTVVSSVGAGASTHVDVIDVATRTRVATLEDEIVLAITDDAAVVLRASGIAKVDLRSGATQWSSATGRVFAVLADPGRVVVAFDHGDQYVIAAITDDGVVRDLKVQTGLARGHVQYLAPELSTPDKLVLLPDVALGAALAAHATPSAVVLDPSTGQLSKTAFGIGAP
jgi:hypothetical protein